MGAVNPHSKQGPLTRTTQMELRMRKQQWIYELNYVNQVNYAGCLSFFLYIYTLFLCLSFLFFFFSFCFLVFVVDAALITVNIPAFNLVWNDELECPPLFTLPPFFCLFYSLFFFFYNVKSTCTFTSFTLFTYWSFVFC